MLGILYSFPVTIGIGKMPGLSYSLPAWECKTGSKLRKIKGSVCASCYALKGNYTRYQAIKAAQYIRLEALKNDKWVEAMVVQMPPEVLLVA